LTQNGCFIEKILGHTDNYYTFKYVFPGCYLTCQANNIEN